MTRYVVFLGMGGLIGLLTGRALEGAEQEVWVLLLGAVALTANAMWWLRVEP